MGRLIKFNIDVYQWVFPISIELNLVGNNYRPYNLIIKLLCFNLIICIDEDTR